MMAPAADFRRVPKIERWCQTLKKRILLGNKDLRGDLDAHIGDFVEHYNSGRYHESLKNPTAADVYFGRSQNNLAQREWIKRKTIQKRRMQYLSFRKPLALASHQTRYQPTQ